MSGNCPAGRSCKDCVYVKMCGGCLGDACVHMRTRKRGSAHSTAKCLFCEMMRIDDTCLTQNPPPPKKFDLIPPHVLEQTIEEWQIHMDEMTEMPEEPDWPLLIPEVSNISETTHRLGVWPDEGDFGIKKFDPIAWDMTGNLFDKIQRIWWVRETDSDRPEDWHEILGPHDNWINNILFVDRLPDRLAMQTPPSALMVAYLNRLYAYYWKIVYDEDAPRIWLMTHGYPSYIDWPPAWHWNLGIRMLCSLQAYIGSQGWDFMGTYDPVWYPDKSRKTTQPLRVPFVPMKEGARLLFKPDSISHGPTEMDWYPFPGIVPFVPGADTNQLSWFTKHIVQMGYTTLAIDAVNSIAHENFRGLREAVSAVHRAGAKHVIIYGPWPLHPPRKFMPIRNVSYIPTSLHMNMTNNPRRYWRKKGVKTEYYQKTPNHRITSLPEVVVREDLEICDCPACKAGETKEVDPRSIWRWWHMLFAAVKWEKRVKKKLAQGDVLEPTFDNTRLWYQGPSYTVFRKCLHYPPEYQWEKIPAILETLVFNDTKMEIQFPDGETALIEKIRWTDWDEGHTWWYKFPKLEE
ncbi:MAG: hypothetical protein GF411_16560 [Candidatus Lokiarchaeota archaeon]|nr:hypothetical protein [Candidatus Lokiarchaeota archaeon]